MEIELRDHSKDPADYTVTIEPGSDGEACFALVDKQVRDGKLLLTLQSLKPGHAYIEVLGPDGFAFMEGMQLTSIAGAVLMLLASVLAYKSLKHLRTAH